MGPHPHIVAAQHQDHQQTQAMDSQFPAQLRQVGQPGAKGQHQKHKTQGQQALGCEGLAIRPFEEPVVFDVGFFLKKGRYLPKLGWELIRFIQENTLRGGT